MTPMVGARQPVRLMASSGMAAEVSRVADTSEPRRMFSIVRCDASCSLASRCLCAWMCVSDARQCGTALNAWVPWCWRSILPLHFRSGIWPCCFWCAKAESEDQVRPPDDLIGKARKAKRELTAGRCAASSETRELYQRHQSDCARVACATWRTPSEIRRIGQSLEEFTTNQYRSPG
jgi:hypothetical protein